MDFREKFSEVTTELTEAETTELSEKVDISSDEIGITGYGDIVSVFIKKAKYNDLMELEVKGSKILPKIKSLESLLGQYKEDDWNTLEKIYKKYTAEASSDVAKAITEFEKNLAKAFKILEVRTGKL